MASPNARDVRSYGTLVAGDNSPATALANQRTINTAIDTLGAAGGGTICLPQGRFFIAFSTGFAGISASNSLAIYINRSNITLWGAGVGQTVLLTPPEYRLVNGEVVRGTGIWISAPLSATLTNGQDTKNITLRDFELDGQTGWTGRYGFPASPIDGDGWDITHKGIILSQGRYVDNVIIQDFYIHRYKGEVIYGGGERLGRVRLTRVKSEDINASTYNLTGAAIVEDSEFGLSRFWIEVGTAFANKSGYFRNNYFHDARSGTGIGLAQGDGLTQPYTFVNNRFENCVGVLGVYGGVGGPIVMSDNTVTNCAGDFFQGGVAPNTVIPGLTLNKNIVIERNVLTNVGTFAALAGRLDNVTFRDNEFVGRGTAGGTGTVIMGSGGNLTNITVLNNRFSNARAPTATGGFAGFNPLFVGNSYSIIGTLTTGSPLVPRSEFMGVNLGSNATAVLATAQYVDGQMLTITGGTATRRVNFVAGTGNGYSVPVTRVMDGAHTLVMRFDAAAAIWREVSYQ